MGSAGWGRRVELVLVVLVARERGGGCPRTYRIERSRVCEGVVLRRVCRVWCRGAWVWETYRWLSWSARGEYEACWDWNCCHSSVGKKRIREMEVRRSRDVRDAIRRRPHLHIITSSGSTE